MGYSHTRLYPIFHFGGDKIEETNLCIAFMGNAFSLAVPAFAADSNIDGGGGGMNQGTAQNSWTPGRDGVRITVIRDSDNTPISTPIDFSNGSNGDMAVHFGKVSKISYRSGSTLTPHTSKYVCYQPSQAMPRIVSSNGSSNISAIRSYFCREGTIRDIANATGMDYDTLINGKYKILLEPIAYFKYNSVMFAMTATEAALYNKQVGNGLRSKMVSLSHKNLPLSMFLETPVWALPLGAVPQPWRRATKPITHIWEWVLSAFQSLTRNRPRKAM